MAIPSLGPSGRHSTEIVCATDFRLPPDPALSLSKGATWLAVDTVVGPLWIAQNGHGICLSRLGGSEGEFATYCLAQMGERPIPLSDSAVREAVNARLNSDQPLDFDLSRCSAFQRQVLEAVNRIPRGEVCTYRDVAAEIGRPLAVRAVGHALATNPIPVLIPCHRVLRSDGGLGGYTPRLETKSTLLNWEGARQGLEPFRGR